MFEVDHPGGKAGQDNHLAAFAVNCLWVFYVTQCMKEEAQTSSNRVPQIVDMHLFPYAPWRVLPTDQYFGVL